jgi:hypothetical protein
MDKLMLTFTLSHYGTGSILSCLDGLESRGSIVYTRKIHRYESESDFKAISSENQTYGETAALELFTYFQMARRYK